MGNGIKVGGILISMIRFTDDIVLVAETEHHLQRVLAEIKTIINEYQMSIDSNKSKILVCVQELIINTNINLGKQLIAYVSSFKYLSS